MYKENVVAPDGPDVVVVMNVDTHNAIAPIPHTIKVFHEGAVDLTEGAVKWVSSLHRHQSLPPTDNSKVDIDEAARSNKRSRHGKHRSSSSTKLSRSSNYLVDTTKDKDKGFDMAEVAEQPRPVH
ncbi:hypothetical protein V6N13_130118 [Hibiscus sabdariffa]